MLKQISTVEFLRVFPESPHSFPVLYDLPHQIIHATIVNKIDGLENHWNCNTSDYVCFCSGLH